MSLYVSQVSSLISEKFSLHKDDFVTGNLKSMGGVVEDFRRPKKYRSAPAVPYCKAANGEAIYFVYMAKDIE